MANIFTAGPARALFFYGQQLIGVGKTLSDTTFDASITGEEVRGGPGNLLYGKYFHDSNLNIQITDALFNLQYVAASLGVDVEQGGVTLYESAKAGETVAAGGKITLTNTAVAFDGVILAWYKKPADDDWTVATVSENAITIPSATTGDHYCVKYFYQNMNAKSITIKAQYVPKTLHLVLINDLYSGDVANVGSASKYGRLITDIPSYQLDGSQNLSWSATSTATVSLNGSALAVDDGASCEEDPIYGTMTQEIFGAKWQDDVKAVAIGNADLEIGATPEALQVYAVFGGGVASRLMDNSNFTFAVESGTSATVDATTGVVTKSTGTGTTVISATLKDASGKATDKVGYANVTPAA
nr:MAG TPA: structural protein [Caudoviricetes sp.]